jgi:hypothetical protein
MVRKIGHVGIVFKKQRSQERCKREDVSMRIALAMLGLIYGICPAVAVDDEIAAFYKGKQMQFIIRTPPGGDYDS